MNAFMDSDPHIADVVHTHFNLRRALVEEFIWWSKCGLVITCTVIAGLLVGWGLAKL